MQNQENSRLDPINWKLLRELQDDGRLSFAELGRSCTTSQRGSISKRLWNKVGLCAVQMTVTGAALLLDAARSPGRTRWVRYDLCNSADQTMPEDSRGSPALPLGC
jgi:hypothetical protein